jgi:hypothetical protein
MPSADIIRTNKHDYAFPAFNKLFDLLKSPVTAFRLIRRPPNSTYELHEDTDRGENVWRFQVPIRSGPAAVICLSDKKSIPEIRSEVNAFTPSRFKIRFTKHTIATMEPGWLYAFNVDHVHTLHNGEATDRITLLIDAMLTKEGLVWWKNNATNVLK